MGTWWLYLNPCDAAFPWNLQKMRDANALKNVVDMAAFLWTSTPPANEQEFSERWLHVNDVHALRRTLHTTSIAFEIHHRRFTPAQYTQRRGNCAHLLQGWKQWKRWKRCTELRIPSISFDRIFIGIFALIEWLYAYNNLLRIQDICENLFHDF